MKNILFVKFLFIPLLLFFVYSHSQTVTNGSFELSEGVTGWSQANYGTLTHSTTEGKSSLGAAKLVAGETSTTSYMHQTISNPTFENGTTTFRFHYWIKGTAGNKFRSIIIYDDPDNLITGDTYQADQTFTTDGWEMVH